MSLPPANDTNADAPVCGVILDAPMAKTNKAGSVEAFDSSVSGRVARICSDKTYFRPHVLDVRNHICDI